MSNNNALRWPMTPPESRSQSMRSNEDLQAFRPMPFRRQSTMCEEPESVLNGQLSSVTFDQPQPRAITQIPRRRQFTSSQYSSPRQFSDPTSPFTSPPPPVGNQRPSTIPIDAAQLDELLRRANENAGNDYGETIVEGNARVLQGNLYSGSTPPRNMRKHNYRKTINRTKPNETGGSVNGVIQGNASADAINETGFFRSGPVRTHSSQYHFGNSYQQPQHSYQPPPNRM